MRSTLLITTLVGVIGQKFSLEREWQYYDSSSLYSKDDDILMLSNKDVFQKRQRRRLVSQTDTQRYFETTMEGGDAFYGCMFDVQAKTDIIIQTLNLHTQKPSSSRRDTAAKIYTKLGSFFNNQTQSFYDPFYWTMIATTESLFSNPFVSSTKNLTLLPQGIFNPILIKAGTTQAFYVSLNTSTLVYTNATAMNGVYKSSDDFDFLVGAGVGLMNDFDVGILPASKVSVFYGRVFNGMFQYSRPYYAKPSDTSLIELESTYAGGNGGYGLMFDIAALNSVTFKTLSINVKSTSFNGIDVSVWTLASGDGSYTGHETNPKDWECILTSTVVGAGAGNPTIIPDELFPDIYTNAGRVRAFYISLKTPDLIYTTTSNETYLIAHNDDIQIVNGVGFTGPEFSGDIRPNRAFNGAAMYVTGTVQKTMSKSFATTMGGSNSALGNMFDIEALRDITVKRLDIVIGSLKEVHVAIYTKDGTYRGYGESIAAWTQILSATVTGAGPFTPVRMPEQEFTSVFIKAGKVQGFYVSLNQPELSYTTGTSVGFAYAANEDLTLIEGASLLLNFGGIFEPRRWSGVVYYDSVTNNLVSNATSTPISSNSSSSADPMAPAKAGDGSSINRKTLITTLRGGNSAQGCMFDVTASNPLYILGIDIHTVLKNAMMDVEIFSKQDTYVGHEESPEDWGEPILSTSSMAKGSRNLTPLLDFNSSIAILAGQTRSIYVSSRTANLRYSNWNEAYDSFGNPDMEISVGSGIRLPFKNAVNNRTCNIALKYLLQTESQNALTNTALGNSSFVGTTATGDTMSFGIMFSIKATTDVLIQTLSIHTAIQSNITGSGDVLYVEVFTKSDGYNGFETDPKAWTKVAASKLKSNGRGTFSRIPPENFAGIYVKANSMQSFYVTDTANPTIIYTTDDKKKSSVLLSDKNSQIELFVGSGINSYPFGDPNPGRLFDGLFHFAPVAR